MMARNPDKFQVVFGASPDIYKVTSVHPKIVGEFKCEQFPRSKYKEAKKCLNEKIDSLAGVKPSKASGKKKDTSVNWLRRWFDVNEAHKGMTKNPESCGQWFAWLRSRGSFPPEWKALEDTFYRLLVEVENDRAEGRESHLVFGSKEDKATKKDES